MKKLIAFFTLASALAAYSQGGVNFNNRFVLTDGSIWRARITYGPEGPITAGSNVANVAIPVGSLTYGSNARSALYAGAVGVGEDQMILLIPAVNFLTGANAGLVNVGTLAHRTIAGIPGGSNAWVQVRAWDSGDASASYEEALAKRTQGVYLGKSEIIQIILTESPNYPPNLIDVRTGQPLLPFAIQYGSNYLVRLLQT